MLMSLAAICAAGLPQLAHVPAGILMLGAYEWAFIKPMRKLYYNLTITAVSVVVAVLVGAIEALGLLGNQLHLTGIVWDEIGGLNDNFGTLGFAIIALLIAAWVISILVYRYKGFDGIDVR